MKRQVLQLSKRKILPVRAPIKRAKKARPAAFSSATDRRLSLFAPL